MVEACLKAKVENFPSLTNKDNKKLYDLCDILDEIQSAKENPNLSPLFAVYDSSTGHNAKNCRQKPECGMCKKGHLTTMHNEQRNPPVEPGDHGGEDEAVISAKCTSNVIEVKEMDNVGATVFERTKDDEKPGLSVEDKKFVNLMDANFTMDDDHLMQNGKIRLHKIASSDREILQAFPKEDLSEDLQSLDLSDGSTVLPVHKCLGLDWNLNTDSFLINLQFGDAPFTRRGRMAELETILGITQITGDPKKVCSSFAVTDFRR
nr:hypothetical protein BaRGS_027886 [Batillaria attramentaria]